ncbi:MAG: bifunctional adenosylcobinamide kinase/adenosylcobinamide-phosphate guanylyltransferase [Chloroflexota bacterium]
MGKIILVTGGARSGKSHFAQQLALESKEPVLFVATAEAGDDEMRRRIEEHRRQRPPTWRTLETPTQVAGQIPGAAAGARTVIVDCITLLVSNILLKHGEGSDTARATEAVMTEMGELARYMDRTRACFIIVTNEVGLGLVPASGMGRLYRDLLGKANQVLAQRADEVYLMVCGIPMLLKPARPSR